MEKTHIDRLVTPDYFNRKECEGCGCCISICPYEALSMQTCADGIRRPRVDMTKCLRCNRCMDACEIYKCYYIPQENMNLPGGLLYEILAESTHLCLW